MNSLGNDVVQFVCGKPAKPLGLNVSTTNGIIRLYKVSAILLFLLFCWGGGESAGRDAKCTKNSLYRHEQLRAEGSMSRA